jgi:hypothetical protein
MLSAVNAPHLVALVRVGARFERGNSSNVPPPHRPPPPQHSQDLSSTSLDNCSKKAVAITGYQGFGIGAAAEQSRANLGGTNLDRFKLADAVEPVHLLHESDEGRYVAFGERGNRQHDGLSSSCRIQNVNSSQLPLTVSVLAS